MEILTAIFAIPLAKWSIITITPILAGHLVKKIPYVKMRRWTDRLISKVNRYMFPIVDLFFYGIGASLTVFFGKRFKYTKLIWNNIIEPVVINILNDVIFRGIVMFFRMIINLVERAQLKLEEGLLSDNKEI